MPKYIQMDLGVLFQVSFCMEIHESPKIPKSRHQQANIVENLRSLDFSPQESAREITLAGPTAYKSSAASCLCHRFRFLFSFFFFVLVLGIEPRALQTY